MEPLCPRPEHIGHGLVCGRLEPLDHNRPSHRSPGDDDHQGRSEQDRQAKLKFKFTSDEPGSTFECKVDKKRFKPCTSPRKVKRLDDGKHKFKVIATDAAGNVDPSAAKDKWRVVD